MLSLTAASPWLLRCATFVELAGNGARLDAGIRVAFPVQPLLCQPGSFALLQVGINGFGRIGRLVARAVMERSDMELVAINVRALAPPFSYPCFKRQDAHLLLDP